MNGQVGTLLRELRGAITLDELAAAIGGVVSRTTIGSIETGKGSPPSSVRLRQIGAGLEALGVSGAVDKLLLAAGYASLPGPAGLLVNLHGFIRQWGSEVTPLGIVQALNLGGRCPLRAYYPWSEKPDFARNLELAGFSLVECHGRESTTIDAMLFHEALVLLGQTERQEVYLAGFESADMFSQLRQESKGRTWLLVLHERLPLMLREFWELLVAAGPYVKPLGKKFISFPKRDSLWERNLEVILQHILNTTEPESGWSIPRLGRDLREHLTIPAGKDPATYIEEEFAHAGGVLAQEVEFTRDGSSHRVIRINFSDPKVQEWLRKVRKERQPTNK